MILAVAALTTSAHAAESDQAPLEQITVVAVGTSNMGAASAADVDISNSCPIFQQLMSNRTTAAGSSDVVFGVMLVRGRRSLKFRRLIHDRNRTILAASPSLPVEIGMPS